MQYSEILNSLQRNKEFVNLHFRGDIECQKPAGDTNAVCQVAGRSFYSLTIGQEKNLPILEERMFGSKSGENTNKK